MLQFIKKLKLYRKHDGSIHIKICLQPFVYYHHLQKKVLQLERHIGRLVSPQNFYLKLSLILYDLSDLLFFFFVNERNFLHYFLYSMVALTVAFCT